MKYSPLTYEPVRPEAVLSHDDEVGEEPGRGLDETQLAVAEEDELLVDELVGVGVPGLPPHQVLLGLLEGEADGGQHVGPEVDTEDSQDPQRQGNACNHAEQEGGELGHVGGERVEQTFLEILEHQPALLHPRHDGGEVVVEEDNVGTLGAVRRSAAHSNTHVSSSDGCSVVDT